MNFKFLCRTSKKNDCTAKFIFLFNFYGLKNFKDVVEKLSCDLNIENLLNRSYGSLSAGQKTKVNLCKALLNKPKLLLLDEPTASLDPETSIFIRNYLMDYKINKSSILITSHNLDEIKTVCSNIVLLKSGEIVAQGKIKNVLDNYKFNNLIEFFVQRLDNVWKNFSVNY